ncbi:MAG TPA: methyltransferase domain-containing protein [Solirubrobacterales bacterium]|nr:methyltransferase domain-containing protein [Solirubrobacterales bacterium]
MPSPASPNRIKEVNERYHDAAAESYDSKWGIDFGATGQEQVTGKLRKALGRDGGRTFDDALEIGAGTGYFSLNLLQAGLIERATATDISPGMLATLERNAADLGLEVRTAAAEAETLPFADESFDLVFGHAVLHHIPELRQAFSEFARVLRPGGALAFCGEPSRYGDFLAALPKRTALLAAPLWRRLVGASARRYEAESDPNGHGLEFEVDVHAFSPGDLRRFCRDAGLSGVRVRGEELLASMHGWTVRTLEASAEPDQVPWGWRRFAFRSYLALQRVDNQWLEPRLPPELFYNLLVAARKP